jgi:hypothetical protein
VLNERHRARNPPIGHQAGHRLADGEQEQSGQRQGDETVLEPARESLRLQGVPAPSPAR